MDTGLSPFGFRYGLKADDGSASSCVPSLSHRSSGRRLEVERVDWTDTRICNRGDAITPNVRAHGAAHVVVVGGGYAGVMAANRLI